VVPGLDEGTHEGTTNGAGSSGDEDSQRAHTS
jgi:hypothetical protein